MLSLPGSRTCVALTGEPSGPLPELLNSFPSFSPVLPCAVMQTSVALMVPPQKVGATMRGLAVPANSSFEVGAAPALGAPQIKQNRWQSLAPQVRALVLGVNLGPKTPTANARAIYSGSHSVLLL